MELARIRPVKPPNEKESRKPKMKKRGVIRKYTFDQRVRSQFKSLIPVGMAIILVEEVK